MNATCEQVEKAGESVGKARPVREAGSLGKTTKVAILYDRLESMLAANQALAQLPSGAGPGTEWTVNSWQFDLLKQGIEARRALADTSDARLIILAISGARALRSWPRDWLESWAAQRKGSRAALGVFLIGRAGGLIAESVVIAPLRVLAAVRRLRIFRFLWRRP